MHWWKADDILLNLVQYCLLFWRKWSYKLLEKQDLITSFLCSSISIYSSDTAGIMCSLFHDLAWLGVDLFFMFLDWNISHGTDIGFHRLSLIQHPACHLAHSAVLASKGAPITLFSYWFNSLLIEKLLRNGSQKRKGEDKGLVFSLLLIRSSFRVLFSPVAESKTV